MTLATFAVVCAACGGGTAETSSEDGPSASAAESGTTSVPKPETATEQPDDDDASDPDDDDASDPDNDGDGGDDDVVAAGTTVLEPQNAAPTVGVIAASEVAAGEAVTVDLSSFFGDPDGDELAYEAASSDAAVAVVSVSGSEVSIEGASEGAATVTVTARDPGGLSAEQSFDVVVRRYVVSLGVADIEPLTAVGETRQLSVSADHSDGSNQAVDAALVQWLSSDPAVAGVSEGMVTAAGAGNATITAAYEQHSVEVAVSVRISVHETGTVRLLYAAPAEREFRADYSEYFQHAMAGLQSWYRQQLGGLTFSLYDAKPQECRLPEPLAYYGRHSWQRVLDGVRHCAPVTEGTSTFVWVIYADVDNDCAADGSKGEYADGYDQLGRGGPGLTMLELYTTEGFGRLLTGEERVSFYYCDEGPHEMTLGTAIGGLGHEFGHALGLPHPPGCDQGLPSCDYAALMGSGSYAYPDTYLRADHKEMLLRSPFIGAGSGSGRLASALPGASRVKGSVAGSDGSAVEGVRVSLVAEDFWAWAATGEGGTFEIAVPEGSSGSAVVSVHANETAACRWLGYYDDSGALTVLQHHAEPLSVSGSDISGVDITLPASPDEMCRGQRTITGTVLDPNAEPVEEVWVGNYALGQPLTGSDGTFEIRVPEGTSGPYVVVVESPECGLLGFYSPEGFTADPYLATEVWIGGVDATGLVITLPASVDELCGQQNAQ